MGTNDFRSTKRHIEHATITGNDGYGLYIDSDGEQNVRASVETDRIAVYVNDWLVARLREQASGTRITVRVAN